MSFVARLKQTLVGDSSARFIYLNNFEVERTWARGEPHLPGAGISFSSAVVNRMEEMGVLLSERDDVVVLKAPLDVDHAEHLQSVGAIAGRTLCTDHNRPTCSVTEDVLASPVLLDELRRMADEHTYLMPMGVSSAEERLAKETGLSIAGASAQVCKVVNSKIFSRRLVDAHGLTAVPGAICETVGELANALETHLPTSGQAVVKEALGVSGRGMIVLDSPQQAAHLVRMLSRRGVDARADMVVESWIDKAADLNYQFIISRTGEVHFETIKAAVVKNGVHKGHEFPVELPTSVLDGLHRAADLIGHELYTHGYFGVVGVDAMLGRNGTLYPCLEINARFNMATYQGRIADRFLGPGRHAVAATIGLTLTRRYSFGEVIEALGDIVFAPSGRSGVLITNFATLNAAAGPEGRTFHGRLYVICIADDAEFARDLQRGAEVALHELVGQA